MVTMSLQTKEFRKRADNEYEFKGIASSDKLDSHKEFMDIDSMELACKYPTIQEEHQPFAVGNVIEFSKSVVNGSKVAVFKGQINGAHYPDVVSKIKTGVYKSVSVGGGCTRVEPDGRIVGALISEISLVNNPANKDAIIFEKSRGQKDIHSLLKLLIKECEGRNPSNLVSLASLISMSSKEFRKFLSAVLDDEATELLLLGYQKGLSSFNTAELDSLLKYANSASQKRIRL